MNLTRERAFLYVQVGSDGSVTGVCELCLEDEVEANPYEFNTQTWTVSETTRIVCTDCGESNEEQQ